MNLQKTKQGGKRARSLKKDSEAKPLNKLIKGQKYLWKIKDIDQNLAQKISFDHSLSLPISQVLSSRGFLTKEQIK